MGTLIEYRKLPDKQTVYRLLIYSKMIPEIASNAASINKNLAAELINLKPTRRTIQLEKCFVKVLNSLPEQPVIKDIDVMFNPAYRVDVMKILTSAYKQKPYSLIWLGICSDGKLIYSEEGYQDYRVYEIKDYDIMCII